MSNPLTEMHDLPQFSKITPDLVKPAVEAILAECRQSVEHVAGLSAPVKWEEIALPIDDMDDKFSRAWSAVSHMNSVVNTPELREAYESSLPLISEYGTWVGQHQGLYEVYRAFADSEEFKTCNPEQKKEVENALRDFELSGIALPDDKKQRYGEIQMRLSELSSTYSNNVLDATMGWTKLVTDEADLAGLPETAIALAKQLAEEKEQQGWLFTLDIPSYLPVVTYADNAELRREMYTAYSTRASDQGPNAGEWDNSAIMDEILALRHELAQLLGFASYAEKSLATKMAESTEQVLSFLTELAEKSKPQAEKDLAELRDFAKQAHDVDTLNAWDLAYYSEKLKQNKYSISDEELRPYFPENKVIAGLFETVQRVFGLTIMEERSGIDKWHDSVRYFNVYDKRTEYRGSFYLDLYARPGKRGGAWMDDCMTRRFDKNHSLQHPVAYLTCNFNKPVGDQPALFTHDEVVTLFHEFGHGMHHMLTKCGVSAVSGINGVPWDAVELPSQFMENFCWQPEVLSYLSGHFETGEPLPQEMLDKMLAAKNFQSAMMMLRQLEFSIFDFKLHADYSPESGAKIQETLDAIRQEISVFIPPAFNRFQHGFSHIFAGGYAAGYYSYKWAEVLSADAFGMFEEKGIFHDYVGLLFLRTILEKGGSEDPMELFKAFRSREPNIDALLRHSGIS